MLASACLDVFSDCSNVVTLACRPKAEQLCGKRAYSGAFLQLYAQGISPSTCTKVAAHKELDEAGIDAAERWRRLGNHHADAAAKHAVQLHPSCPDKLAAAEKLVTQARQTIRLAAHVLHVWPALDLSEVGRIPAPHAAAAATAGHRWEMWAGVWRCAVCLRGKRSQSRPLPGVCSQVSRLHASSQDALEHRTIAFDCSDGSVLFICTRCKAHSNGAPVRG